MPLRLRLCHAAFLLLLLIWISLNVVLLIKSFIQGHFVGSIVVLFPLNYRSDPGLWAYDFTEFICYVCFVPVLVFKKYARLVRKGFILISLLTFAYCDFVLGFLTVSDNYPVAGLLLSIIYGVVMFAGAMYVTGLLFDILRKLFSRR